MIKLTLNPSQIDKALSRIASSYPKAVARAVNRAASSARTVMVRSVAKDLGIKQATVRERIPINKATAQKLTASLECVGARIPLIEFGAKGPEPSRGRGNGVSYRLPGGAGRLPHAFIATMPAGRRNAALPTMATGTGHRGVFARAGKTRLKIIERFGPSMPKVFEKYEKETTEAFEAAFAKNFEHELSFALRQASA